MNRRQGPGHTQPLEFRFISQSGPKVDAVNHRSVRSHVMKDYRRLLRSQRQQALAPSSEQSDTGDPFCECRSAPLDHASPGPNDDRSGVDVTSVSVYCIKCGRVLLLGAYQLGDMGRRGHDAPMDRFTASDFDPFESIALSPALSSKYATEMNVLKKHAITLCSPGTMRSVIFPEAVRTPALMGGILFMAYSYLCCAKGTSNLELALTLKGAVMSEINRKLSHPSTALCTNVIASIAYLAAGTWAFGNNEDEMQTHLSGMEIMVKQRGMDSLGVYSFGQTVRQYLIVQHYLLAAIRSRPLTIPFDFSYHQASARYFSPLYCPENDFRSFLRPDGRNESTVNMLYAGSGLMNLMIDYDEGLINETNFNYELCKIKSELENSFSTYESQLSSGRDCVFECCHLTVVIILAAIETFQPLASSDPLLTLRLVNALERTDLGDTWGDLLGVLYWVSIVGSASSQNGPGYRLLDMALGITMSKLACSASEFYSAIAPVKQFLRLQQALEKRSRGGFSVEF